MTIELNHTIVPARDKVAAAQFFAKIFGLRYEPSQSYFAAVRVNESLTLDFSNSETIEGHHYAFKVSEDERCHLRPHSVREHCLRQRAVFARRRQDQPPRRWKRRLLS